MIHSNRGGLALFMILITTVSVGAPADAEDEAVFPDAWIGTWKGELEIHYAGSPDSRTLPMTLEIEPHDEHGRWKFGTTYGEEAVRAYELVELDRKAGRYVIDEKDSIRLPATFVSGELVTNFAVVGNHMIIAYRLVGDTLEFRTWTGTVEPTGRTGGKDDAPTVLTFGVKGVQRASLERE